MHYAQFQYKNSLLIKTFERNITIKFYQFNFSVQILKKIENNLKKFNETQQIVLSDVKSNHILIK